LVCAVVLVLAAWTFSPGQATGWSAGGHRVVADLAYDLLEPAERTHVVAILRKHKDFDKHFKKPMATQLPGANAADEERWIFLQASIWPDLIGSSPWHYVNFPLFLSEADEMALKNEIKPNLNSELPKSLSKKKMKDLNCIQAVKLSLRKLNDAHTEDAEKAIYYCWLMHLVGDIHQPLHSTSLVSRARFNQNEGDRGGNGVKTKQEGSLHSYWDSRFGRGQHLDDIRERTKKIADNAGAVKAGESARSKLNPNDWVSESHHLAKTVVYTKEILNAVSAGELTPNAPLKKIDLSDAYRKQAHEIADRRVAEAGYRLAAILKSLD